MHNYRWVSEALWQIRRDALLSKSDSSIEISIGDSKRAGTFPFKQWETGRGDRSSMPEADNNTRRVCEELVSVTKGGTYWKNQTDTQEQGRIHGERGVNCPCEARRDGNKQRMETSEEKDKEKMDELIKQQQIELHLLWQYWRWAGRIWQTE